MNSRPTRARPRLWLKSVVGALLVLVGLLAPQWAPPPLDSEQAAAQQRPPSVVDGTPSGCPSGWTADFDVCRVQQPACPYDPFYPTQLMQLSSEYPDFCEVTVDAAADRASYDLCAVDPAPGGMAGFAVIEDPATCRALTLRTCEVGTRIDSAWCQGTIRRSWTCPQPNAVSRNEFNTCYIVPSILSLNPHPACGAGAPDLVVIECAVYVGTDFIEPPNAVLCGSYDTGTGPSLAASPNGYWCTFNSALLNVACHSAVPPVGLCGASTAMCLKRGSGTGGCVGIARTIRCRGYQHRYQTLHIAALADNTIDQAEETTLGQHAESVRADGCEPCQTLPFEPIPRHCPDDTYQPARPRYPRVFQFQAVQQRSDINLRDPACNQLNSWDPDITMVNPNNPALDCSAAPQRCGSLPAGNPAWTSTHFSGLAVTNSSVVVRLHDAPSTYRTQSSFSVNSLARGQIRWVGDEYPEFPGSGPLDNREIVRSYSPARAGFVTESPGFLGNVSDECVPTALPMYRLTMQELWPDRPADETAILSLFGTDALDWWNDLASVTGAQQRRTEARGLVWWPDATPAERAEREDTLDTKVDCNAGQDVEVWCRWSPARPGYYRLFVGGGWMMDVGGARGWYAQAGLQNLSNDVTGLSSAQKTKVYESLVVLGCGPDRAPDPSCGLSPVAIGVQPDLSDIVWPSGDLEELYRLGGDTHKHLGLDLRVDYTDFGATTKYTETAHFGVEVHEVRVSTVTPTP